MMLIDFFIIKLTLWGQLIIMSYPLYHWILFADILLRPVIFLL